MSRHGHKSPHDHPKLEVVAKAIYYANWRQLPQGNFPPLWEYASDPIKQFVLRQAENACKAFESSIDDPTSFLPLDLEAAAYVALPNNSEPWPPRGADWLSVI